MGLTLRSLCWFSLFRLLSLWNPFLSSVRAASAARQPSSFIHGLDSFNSYLKAPAELVPWGGRFASQGVWGPS